jgi:epoxyqueuosine reductase
MGEWVFGCDVCQQVCPWNVRFAPTQGDPAFSPRPEAPWVDLEAELGLTLEAFNRKFKDSPVKRPKRRGYLRNVAVALGNASDPGSISALRHALLNDPDALVRGHAAWALGQIGGEEAAECLEEAADRERDAWVLEEIWAAQQVDSLEN